MILDNTTNSYDQMDKKILTSQEIIDHIQKGEVEFVEASSLLKDTPESCVDGRCDHGVVGMPGGNAGEFVLALTAYEQITGQTIILDQMQEILRNYLAVAGKFYLHTDAHALRHMGISEQDLRNPSEENKEQLLEKLTNPNNIGCGHLRLMIQNPDQYGVRAELVESFLKAYFELLWRGDNNIDFGILSGEHKEGAVVNILIKGEVEDNSKIPVIAPEIDGVQMFVNHPQVSDYLRKITTAEADKFLPAVVNPDQYQQKLSELGKKHLTTTVGHLAKGLPVYNAFFTVEGKLDRVE